MTALRSWIHSHPVLAFVLVAYGFSWGLWALMIAVWGKINWLGSFGPSLAAVVVVAITGGRAALGQLLRPVLKGRFGLAWYLFITVGAALLYVLGLWLYRLLGGVIALPVDKLMPQLTLLPIYYVIVLIIGGPLGEELGWRGFLLPHFLKARSPLLSSLLVAVFWFAWHLPLFWLPGASQQGVSLGAFALHLLAWSVLFTWVYLGTRGSLLSALLLHTSINTFSLVLSETDPAHADGPLLIFAIVISIAALLVILIDKRISGGPEPKAAIHTAA